MREKRREEGEGKGGREGGREREGGKKSEIRTCVGALYEMRV